MAVGQQQMSPAQINAQARALINALAVPREQIIFSQAYAAVGTANISGSQPVVSVQPRMVGLIRGFTVKVQVTVTNGSAVQIDLTDFGPANLLNQIQFQDLQNNTRIQTPGWHIAFLNTAKQRRPYGTSLVRGTGFDDPINFGSNMAGQISAPATIPAGESAIVTMWYYVPLAYSEKDLRGAVYANVVNATMQLNLTFNTNPVVAAAADATLAVYQGDIAGSVALAVMSAATVTVYQDYLDQLPVGQAGVILPPLDLATIYDIKNTVLTAIVANTDFPVQYANFRDFLSTWVIYVNTAAGGVRGNGSDINFFALQSANFTNLWKRNPDRIALANRNSMQVDPPPGAYYLSSRERPISTQQYGNMELVLNAATAGTGAYLLMGFESFAMLNNVVGAGSLAAS
jgi:P3 major capsid protein